MALGKLMTLFLLTTITGFLGEAWADGYCSFLPYLWTSPDDPALKQRSWISGTEYIGNTGNWSKQKQIVVRETEIEITQRIYALCSNARGERTVPCYRQTIRHTVICIQEEMDNKFRVQQKSHKGEHRFTCLKFVYRAPGVVQVYSAVPQDENEGRLCRDAHMYREEWPWIDPMVSTWNPCPLAGGFDFRILGPSHLNCQEHFSPSHIESECMMGDGISFYFPNATCNFFYVDAETNVQSLQCVTSWSEGSHHFILMADSSYEPRYVLRLPSDTSFRRYTAYLYLSLVTPNSGSGQPPGGVTAVHLHMWPSDTEICYDEHEDCEQMAKDGKCSANDVYERVNYHCLKSCGLCARIPSVQPECNFPEQILGKWYLFNQNEMTEINIFESYTHIGGLGNFICKSIHWDLNQYKTLSVFNNGCRPRFTCLMFQKSQQGVLEYKISKSSPHDNSFEQCRFDNDDAPVLDRVRANYTRTLFNDSTIRFSECGLDNVFHVSAELFTGQQCKGTITDVSHSTCQISNSTHLSLRNCNYPYVTDFECVARSEMPSGTSFLVAQYYTSADSTRYVCYVIKSSNPGSSLKQQYMRTNCNTVRIHPSSVLHDNQLHKDRFPVQSFSLFTDRVEHKCVGKVHKQGSAFNTHSTSPSPESVLHAMSSSTTSLHRHSGAQKYSHQESSAPREDNMIYIEVLNDHESASATLLFASINIKSYIFGLNFVGFIIKWCLNRVIL